jgi:hypothetical protein
MEKQHLIESLGYLLKEEVLQHVDHYVLQNTLVLENLEPFPGYHGENMPHDSKPDSIFLITNKQYPAETIFRISEQMCNYAGINFDACPAEIFTHNTQLYGIRIKGLNNYSLISELQGCYLDHGIKFMPGKKINYPGLISIHKVFSLERLADHVYKDLEDERTFYVTIPDHLNWSLFKTVTRNVKNNLDNSNFDCAAGYIFLRKILEVVRIYAPRANVDRLQQIRGKFLDEIIKVKEY